MDTKPDITSREDIATFVNDFYERVKPDPDIGIIFTEVIPIDWDHHIPLIIDFWEMILLDNPVYRQNAMAKHFDINRKFPLKKIHFDAWLRLFKATIDDHFNGPVAELAKKRADSIASVMLLKMDTENLSS